jgi:hypothetical protein
MVGTELIGQVRQINFAFNNISVSKSENVKAFLTLKKDLTLFLKFFMLLNVFLRKICHVVTNACSPGRRVGYRCWQV